MAKLGEIFDLQMGKTPSRNNEAYWNDGKHNWISIADLGTYHKYTGTTKEMITELAVQESGIKKVPKNTVIMSFKLSLGKTAITSEEIYTNEAIMAFIPKKEQEISPDYFYYLFSGKDWSKSTNRAVMGTTLNKATLSEIDVEVPSLETQHSIVEKMDLLYKVIELRKKQLDKHDELVKSRFIEMFGDPAINSKRWEQMSLGELTTKIGSGATPKGGKDAYREDGIALIRSMNVHNGLFEYKDLAHISDEQAAKLDNVKIEENDVLLNITGASVARSCVVPSEILPARVNQHVCIIRCKECIVPEFLNKLLIDDNFQALLWSIATGGATREAITKQQVEELRIITPPIELQNQFVEFTKQVDKSKLAVQKSLDQLEILKKSLMQEYFG